MVILILRNDLVEGALFDVADARSCHKRSRLQTLELLRASSKQEWQHSEAKVVVQIEILTPL